MFHIRKVSAEREMTIQDKKKYINKYYLELVHLA